MNTKVIRTLSFVIVLLSDSVIFAQTYADTVKKADLDRKAAQYRAETGFDGAIEYDLERYVIATVSGTLPDIHLTSLSDTTTKKINSEKILSGILKYFGVPRDQLIYKDEGDHVTYFQEIKGIGFDGREAVLVVEYNISDTTNTRFGLINQLYVIPDMSPQITIDEQEALDIAKPIDLANNPDRPTINVYDSVIKPEVKLVYINYGSRFIPEIRLCWRVTHFGYRVEIDAITGEVIRHYWYGAHSAPK